MSRFLILLLLFTCSIALASKSASAATFDFTGGSSADSVSKQFTAGSLILTVTGGGTSTATSNVTDTNDGLGVIGVGGNPLAGDDLSSPLDSSVMQGPTYANFLELSFNQSVTLRGLTHSLFDATDDYGLTVDGSVLAGPNALTDASLDATTLAGAADRTGVIFRITTASSGGINFPPIETDSFRVASITVVPEPSSLALLGLGCLLCLNPRRVR